MSDRCGKTGTRAVAHRGLDVGSREGRVARLGGRADHGHLVCRVGIRVGIRVRVRVSVRVRARVRARVRVRVG